MSVNRKIPITAVDKILKSKRNSRELIIIRTKLITTTLRIHKNFPSVLKSLITLNNILSQNITCNKVLILLSHKESFVTVKIFESKILMNFDVFEVPVSE